MAGKAKTAAKAIGGGKKPKGQDEPPQGGEKMAKGKAAKKK